MHINSGPGRQEARATGQIPATATNRGNVGRCTVVDGGLTVIAEKGDKIRILPLPKRVLDSDRHIALQEISSMRGQNAGRGSVPFLSGLNWWSALHVRPVQQGAVHGRALCQPHFQILRLVQGLCLEPAQIPGIAACFPTSFVLWTGRAKPIAGEHPAGLLKQPWKSLRSRCNCSAQALGVRAPGACAVPTTPLPRSCERRNVSCLDQAGKWIDQVHGAIPGGCVTICIESRAT